MLVRVNRVFIFHEIDVLFKKEMIIFSLLMTLVYPYIVERQSWSWSYGSWIYNYLSPLTLWVWTPFIARCTRCNILCDNVCQWLVTGRWFSQSTPVSSTNKTVRHDIAEILLKVALNTIYPNHFEGENWDARCEEKSIFDKTYQ